MVSKNSLETLNKDASDFRTSPPLDMLNNDARYASSIHHPSSNYYGSPAGYNPKFDFSRGNDKEKPSKSPSRLLVKREGDILEVLTHSSSGVDITKSGKKKKKIDL